MVMMDKDVVGDIFGGRRFNDKQGAYQKMSRNPETNPLKKPPRMTAWSNLKRTKISSRCGGRVT
jgi:hypothetical protein